MRVFLAVFLNYLFFLFEGVVDERQLRTQIMSENGGVKTPGKSVDAKEN